MAVIMGKELLPERPICVAIDDIHQDPAPWCAGHFHGRSKGHQVDISQQTDIERRLREQAHELAMVSWLNGILATESDLEKLMQTVIDVGRQLSGAQFGMYFHRVPESAESGYELYAASGMGPETCGHLQPAHMATVFAPVFDGTAVVRSDDILADSRYDRQQFLAGIAEETSAVRSCLIAPVISRTGEMHGYMLFGHPESGRFDADDERLIGGIATQASIAVGNAGIYRNLNDKIDEVHRQYEQLNAIYTTAPVGLCCLDEDLRIINMNEHLLKMVGSNWAEVRHMTLPEALGDAGIALEPLCQEALAQPRPLLEREVSWKHAGSGELCYWLCSCHRILTVDGRVQGVNTVVQDITDRKHAELDLARLGSIVSSSYDAIIGKTLDGTITSWNKGAERIYGYSEDEAVGRSISMLLPEDRRREELDILRALAAGNHVSLSDTIRIRKDGEGVRVALTISPVRNSIGTIVGVSTIARDITASKLAEQALRENAARMRSILQATRVGTWDWDMDSGAVRWSDNMEELFGRQPGTFDGTWDSAFADIHTDDRLMVEQAITQAIKDGDEYQMEYRIITTDEQVRWIEAKGQAIMGPGGTVDFVAGICMDITERKQAEEALRISETLLRVQAEELATAHQQKDEFLAMLAHELRNPLAPIISSVQLLKMQDAEQREETLPWALDVIDRQVLQISRIVDDLLDIARITRGRIDLQLACRDLREVIQHAAEAAGSWFADKQQIFEVVCPQQPVPVVIDAGRMIQVISNLLHNASKFTTEYGRISLRLDCQDDEAIITVTDTGAGIPANILPQVFDLFSQADRTLDRRQGGLGLGLSLVKKLVDLHGGQVCATSAGMGHGSEFQVRLPSTKFASTDTDADLLVTGDTSSGSTPSDLLRILVVDDNTQAADAMAMLLETMGHATQVVYSGPDVLEVASEFMPDLVFLDIGLPLMDGYQVARKLRAHFGGGLKLIALTGYVQRLDDPQSNAALFDHYLLKPISLDEMRSLLVRGRGVDG